MLCADFFALPLTSKLDAPFAQMRTLFREKHGEVLNPTSLSIAKGTLMGAKRKGYSLSEDTHDLRLTSELVDLQSLYANPIPCKARRRL